ncbi:DUF3108 domain-containing protein [candidate division KSB1 bacterium]|nr:DUF3108 domain-containing protein [candidate division KSB1 bacterium]
MVIRFYKILISVVTKMLVILIIAVGMVGLQAAFSQDSTTKKIKSDSNSIKNANIEMMTDSTANDSTTVDSESTTQTTDTINQIVNPEIDNSNDADDPFSSVDTTLTDIALADSSKPAPPGFEMLPLSSKKDKFAYFDTTHSLNRVIKQTSFKTGEELTFNIRYGVIVAGSATMSLKAIVTINNRPCYHIVTEARSNRFFSAFYKVRDRVESFMDRDGLYAWRYEKHLREGHYKADQYVEYDQLNRLAITDKRDTLRIPPCIQDILTTFYYIRTLPMEVGKSLFIDNHADKKLYPLEIKVHKKERIKVKAGEFNCLVVEPMLRSDAIFKQRGRLLVWLTDDNRRMPVQMKSKVMIGSITAELKKYKGVVKSK